MLAQGLWHVTIYPVLQQACETRTPSHHSFGECLGTEASLLHVWLGAGIAQLVVLVRRGFDPPLGTFSGRGDFSLGNSIPPKTLSDESINRGPVCAHMHFIALTQKILTFMS